MLTPVNYSSQYKQTIQVSKHLFPTSRIVTNKLEISEVKMSTLALCSRFLYQGIFVTRP